MIRWGHISIRDQTLKWSDVAKIGTEKLLKFGTCIIGSTSLRHVTMIPQVFEYFKDQNCILFWQRGAGHHENKMPNILKCRKESY